MKSKTLRISAWLTLILAVAVATHGWLRHDRHTYLGGATAEFVATFADPPAPGSGVTRREVDELLDLQRTRAKSAVEAARDDRKTEVSRFYGALGFPQGSRPDLPLLRDLMARVEDDFRPYVRDAKEHFRRLRPYEIESRLDPCIAGVRGDLSYPSGHSTFGYVMAYLLTDMIPERSSQLISRADEFARQRMVCGVHFRSDIEAGRAGAKWLAQRFRSSPIYREDAARAAAELRAASPK